MFVLTHMCRTVFCLKGASFGKPRAVTHSFHMCLVVVMFCLKGASFGKPDADREREGREEGSFSVIGIDESVSRKSRRNVTRRKIGHSHQTPHEFYSDGRDLREHLERRAQQAILGENFAQRKL